MPSDATEAALGLLGLTTAFAPPSPTTPTIPAKRKQPVTIDSRDARNSADTTSSESINCICGYTYDDGFSIGCDSCSRWCHAACFSIVENEVPDEWQCWVCAPRHVDKDRAVKLQKARQRQAVSGLNKRRASPGVERKTRRPSAVGQDGGTTTHKRKRRASINVAVHPPQQEDEHVDIDEPWTHSYVPITKDIIPADDTRDRLRRVASDWRGVTAINPPPPTSSSCAPGSTNPALLTSDALSLSSSADITLQQVPTAATAFPSMFANGNLSVRPPSYAIHATQPIPSSKLIAPYPSTIIPTAMYLRDPLNAYAHLGMPKPYVHLFGPPLDVALDARITGDQSRFVRSGCRPNAILRPIFCHSKKPSIEAEEDAVTFGIFALRDLKANEEVVLGWEWDDDNVVHHLPALIHSPFTFPPHQLQHFRNQMNSMLHTLASTFTTCACGAKSRDCVLTRIAEFIENQTPLTPSPSPPSQFAKEKENQKEKDKNAGKGRGKQESEPAEESVIVDLGPLIGVERGFRTRERIPYSGGMGGVELVPPSPLEAGPSRLPAESTTSGTRRVSFPDDLLAARGKAAKKGKDRKGKARAEEEDEMRECGDGDGGRRKSRSIARQGPDASPEPMDVDESLAEECLPPKLRKGWIARSAERLRERRGPKEIDEEEGAKPSGSGETGVDDVKDESYFDSRDMPPPPVPPSRTPPILSATHHPLPISTSSSSSSSASCSSRPPVIDGQTSPSIPFSKLSLLSPVVLAPNASPLSRSRSDSRSPPIPSAPSTSESSSSKTSAKSPSESRKARRPSLSPQPPSEVTKPARPTKAKTKEKEKGKKGPEKDEEKLKGKARARVKEKNVTSKKSACPHTLVTETDAEEPALRPSLLPREDAKGKKPSSSDVARSPTSLVALASSPQPPSKPVAVVPELPPEPPDADEPKPSESIVPCAATSTPIVIVESMETELSEDAMQIDCEPTPKDEPIALSILESTSFMPTSPIAPAPLHLPIATPIPTVAASSPSMEPLPLPPPPSPPASGIHDDMPPAALSVEEAVQCDVPASEPQSPPTQLPGEHVPEGPDVMDIDEPEATKSEPADGDPSSDAQVVFSPPQPSATEPPLASTPEPQLALAHEPESVPLTQSLDTSEPQPTPTSDKQSDPQPDLEPELQAPQTPPPPAKVKLSLKDFALRKKKQREEQMERQREESVRTPTMSPQMPMSSVLPTPEVAAEVGEETRTVAMGNMRKEAEDQSVDLGWVGTGEQVADTDRDVRTGEEARVPEEDGEDGEDVEEPEKVELLTSEKVVRDTPDIQLVPATVPKGAMELAPDQPNGRHREPSTSSDDPQRRRTESPVYEWRSHSPTEESDRRRDEPLSDSYQTKVELLDATVPNGLVAPMHDLSPAGPYPATDVPIQVSASPFTPRTSPKMSHSRVPPAAHPSQEDGEIFSPPPPKAPPLAPRSHTPPTHPRSFYAGGGISPTRRSPPSSARRPLHPTQYSRNPGPPRVVPSAPRALREGGYAPSSMYSGGGGGQNAPYFAPRGPSADRDRERERSREWGRDRGDGDRAWIPGPSRGRGRGGAWGR